MPPNRIRISGKSRCESERAELRNIGRRKWQPHRQITTKKSSLSPSEQIYLARNFPSTSVLKSLDYLCHLTEHLFGKEKHVAGANIIGKWLGYHVGKRRFIITFVLHKHKRNHSGSFPSRFPDANRNRFIGSTGSFGGRHYCNDSRRGI